jgi:hypothetical protein
VVLEDHFWKSAGAGKLVRRYPVGVRFDKLTAGDSHYPFDELTAGGFDKLTVSRVGDGAAPADWGKGFGDVLDGCLVRRSRHGATFRGAKIQPGQSDLDSLGGGF